MARSLQMKLFTIVWLLFLMCMNDVVLGGRTKKMNKSMQMMNKSLNNVLSMIERMRSDKDQCEVAVSNMTTQLQKLSSKLVAYDNIGGRFSGIPHIDLTDKVEKSFRSDGDILQSDRGGVGGADTARNKPIRVDVTSAFDKCMDSLDLHIMPKENAYIWCLRVSLWRFNNFNDSGDTVEDADLEILQVADVPQREKRSARFIRRRLAPRDMTQPPSGFRTRREYRTLSLQERRNFHNALNELYDDGTIDCFSRVHRAALRSKGAHGGVAFLPWHRAFLAMFEEALRQVDDTVSLPYWDSSIDDNMDGGPALSVMWDDEHLGQGSGVVNSGPFSGWVTPVSPLRRDIARGIGSLVTLTRIDTVMSFCRLGEFDTRWENAHNAVHRWVGGTMARAYAASDPVFYMHHAFVDYQWEKFREHQLNDCNVDPAFDYPPTSDTKHAPETTMALMNFLINRDGIANYWTENWYNYEDTPTCATNCGNTSDIFCNPDTNLCTGEIRFDLTLNGRRKKRQADTVSPKAITSTSVDCKKNLYAKGCPGAPRPKSHDELVERIVRHEVSVPPEIEMVDKALKREVEIADYYPPDSLIIAFEAARDAANDCRTIETSVRDLVSAILERKKVTNKRYSGF